MKVKIEDDEVLTLIDGLNSEFYSIVYGVLELIYAADPTLQIGLKGKRITLTKNDNWSKWIFGLTVMSRVINFEINKGALVPDPTNLLQGTHKTLRFVHLKDLAQLKKMQGALVPIIQAALQLT